MIISTTVRPINDHIDTIAVLIAESRCSYNGTKKAIY